MSVNEKDFRGGESNVPVQLSRKNILLACLLVLAVQDGFGLTQIVSNYSWWKIVLMLAAILPWLILISLGYTSLLQYFRRKSRSILATGFGAILFSPLFLVAMGGVLFNKSCAYVDFAYERHPVNNPRYDQEIQLPKGRVYSWILGSLFGGSSGVCAYYERQLSENFFLRECLCRQRQRGTFDLKKVGDNSVECILNDQAERHDL